MKYTGNRLPFRIRINKKKTKFKFSELIDSKLLVRYAPGSMKKKLSLQTQLTMAHIR